VQRDIRPELGQFKVAGVTRQDMQRFPSARSGTPRQAKLILAVCSKAFSPAELWEMRRQPSVLNMAPSSYLVDSGLTNTSWTDQFPLSRICAPY
jgi:hypothetical protein